METFLGSVIASVIACGITWLELDRTFYVPAKVAGLIRFTWWGFVVLNGILAGGLYAAADLVSGFTEQVQPWPIRAVVVGLSYLALIRLKIGTFQTAQGEISAGLEGLYEGMKQAFLRRINQVVSTARSDETKALANNDPLVTLASEARNRIRSNQLLTSQRKRALRAWVSRVEADATSSDMDRRMTLADFILSGVADEDS